MTIEEREEATKALLRAIKAHKSALKEISGFDDYYYEDGIYRFYHHSFKTFRLQDYTNNMVTLFKEMMPGYALNETFMQIVAEGTGKTFTLADNQRWLEATRPILEAFFHAKYFVDMALMYTEMKEEEANSSLPSGWATLLYLYGLR